MLEKAIEGCKMSTRIARLHNTSPPHPPTTHPQHTHDTHMTQHTQHITPHAPPLTWGRWRRGGSTHRRWGGGDRRSRGGYIHHSTPSTPCLPRC